MKKPLFITDAAECIGKTIDGIAVDFGVIIVSFVDGTALAIESDVDYDDSVSLSTASPNITFPKWHAAAEEAGLMSHDEWMEVYRQERADRAKYLREQADELERP